MIDVSRDRGRWLVAVAVLFAGLLMLLAGGTRAEQGSDVGAPRRYRIASQPLDQALQAYVRASGVQVLYESDLTAGHRSADVEGQFTPDVALSMLLAGTGLAARRTDIDTFVIVPPPPGSASSSVSTTRPDERFLTALQAGILRTLCRSAQTRPGNYRIAVELWIGPSGEVQRSALVGSTGNAEQDAAMLGALQRMSIGVSPPAGSRQPFILSIGPRPPRETGDCTG